MRQLLGSFTFHCDNAEGRQNLQWGSMGIYVLFPLSDASEISEIIAYNYVENMKASLSKVKQQKKVWFSEFGLLQNGVLWTCSSLPILTHLTLVTP